MKFITRYCLIIILFLTLGLVSAISYYGISSFKHHYLIIPTHLSKSPISNQQQLNQCLLTIAAELDFALQASDLEASPSLINQINLLTLDRNEHTQGIVDSTKSIHYSLPLAATYDQLLKHPMSHRQQHTQKLIAFIELLKTTKYISLNWHQNFISNGDSYYAENAGIATSLRGSIFTALIYLTIAGILGLITAIYLEEFTSKNIWVNLVEANINNLAAVPSIIYGIIGFIIFINYCDLPRASSIIAGATLSLMLIPIIVIGCREAIASVPKSIKQGAIGLGATKLQTLYYFTLPQAKAQIATTIITAFSRAIGETAPLLIIGMVAFINNAGVGLNAATTTLPVQIFLWSNNAQTGFTEKAAGASLALIVILIMSNMIVWRLRKRN